jgi:hypothetical protein
MLVHVPFVGADVKPTTQSSDVRRFIPGRDDYRQESPYMRGA